MSADLLQRLKAHILQMAPHQKVRLQGKLLIEATAELERFICEDLAARFRVLEAEVSEHPGNPNNIHGSTITKAARLPEYREKVKQLEALRIQILNKGIEI